MQKIITIDGPSGVGKGTASRIIAAELGWDWLDSGALYRLTAYAASQKGVDFADVPGLVEVASSLNVQFSADATVDDPDITLDGVVVNRFIRTVSCGKDASIISAVPAVRAALLARQREFATDRGLVADGRDMGTVVFADAPLKMFLTASAEVRANRRALQLEKAGVMADVKQLQKDIELRDHRDSSRSVSPLKPADDAVAIDTSELSVAGVCARIRDLVAVRF